METTQNREGPLKGRFYTNGAIGYGNETIFEDLE